MLLLYMCQKLFVDRVSDSTLYTTQVNQSEHLPGIQKQNLAFNTSDNEQL